MKIKVSKILLVLCILALIKFSFVPPVVLKCYKFVIIFVTGIFLLENKILNLKRYSWLTLFCICVIVSSFFSYGIKTQFFNGVVYAILLFENFLLINYLVGKYNLNNVMQILFSLAVIICAMNDVLMFLLKMNGEYLIGSKFIVAYWHLLLLAFYVMNYRKNSIKQLFSNAGLLVLAVYVIYICRLVDCSTALVGAVAFLLVMLLPANIKDLLSKPLIISISMLIMAASVFLWENILEIPVVQDIIQNILGRNLTLTGRIKIYEMLTDLIMERPLLGWGYETEIVRETLYGNSQNGLLHITMQYGIIGALVFVCVVWNVFKKKKLNVETYGILALIYAFIIMASVEIVYSYLFFIFLALYNSGTELNDQQSHIGSKKKIKFRIR